MNVFLGIVKIMECNFYEISKPVKRRFTLYNFSIKNSKASKFMANFNNLKRC